MNLWVLMLSVCFINNLKVLVGILEGLSCDNLSPAWVVVTHYGVGCHKMSKHRLWEIIYCIYERQIQSNMIYDGVLLKWLEYDTTIQVKHD